jgi:hypothetical protein
MTTTRIATLSLESWLVMAGVIDRLLSAPYAGRESVVAASRLIRLQRAIERARDDSGLEPVTTKAAREFGELDDKSQRYVFADREKYAAYVNARRAVLEQDVAIDAPMLTEADLVLPLSAAERAVIDPVVSSLP